MTAPGHRLQALLVLAAVLSPGRLGAAEATDSQHRPSVEQSPVDLENPPNWIVFGGGYDPLSNQISISQDLELARDLFDGEGISLFAGGAASPIAVSETDQHETDDAFFALRISLLERWPELSRFFSEKEVELLRSQGAAMLRLIEQSESGRRYRAAMERWERHSEIYEKVRRQRALVARVDRAFTTRALALLLEERGGAAWIHYQNLVACERWAPAISSGSP